MPAADNKRIAKNTVFLFLRMLLSMGVALYTSRVVLEALGVTDYGVYNVVGGLTSMFTFFSSALTNATQRFLNFALGSDDGLKVRQIFNLSLLVYAVAGIAIVAIAIPVGRWFIANELVIPPDKLHAANVILLTVLASLLFTLVGSVYESVLIARENMKIYAYIGIFDVVVKLLIAFSIMMLGSGRLIAYAIMISVATLVQKIVMMIYCRRRYPETRLLRYWNGTAFRELFGFAGWNIYGCAVWMLNEQGVNILLNMFFGPVVNAARGLALQVNSAVNQFSSSFYTAVRPQVIKSYASRQYDEFHQLLYRSGRFSYYLMWFLCVPLMLRPSFILNLWLKEVPEYTAPFLVLVLVYSLINTFNNPLWTAIQAVGKLRKTSIYGSTFYLIAFPCCYLALKMGMSAVSVFYITIIVRFFYLIIAAWILGEYTDVNVKTLMRLIIWPSALISAVSLAVLLPLNAFVADDFVGFLCMGLASVIVNGIVIFSLGMSRGERAFIISKFKTFLNL